MTREEKLARLTEQHKYTRYECIAENAAGEKMLLAYSMQTGRRSLLDCAQKHGPQLIAWLKIGPDASLEFLKPANRGAQIGPASLRFSGRTQRDAIIEGEHPFIGDYRIDA